MADQKPKEGVKTENSDHINLKVAGQDGSVVQFKIKRHTPLSKLMKAYCERQGLSMRQIRFQFDGQPINETDTPAQLEMEDEDTIDVFQQQTGGVYYKENLLLYFRTLFLQTKNTFLIRKLQFGSTTSRLQQYSFLYPFIFPFPIPLLYIK
ncbi:Small ubiquitin-related modifier 2 [Sciurus carolinensis]|uniref:Small ubiquitin-related modifier 2 n=1 Tax=Sciurus carolinensis TaxID=30640 RepID=A0AA41SZN4_SCICA|nr:small ubiquitin-related modifier 2-like [Sciurus carolinensis]MBZ3878024.1 Small ubiquitin-related modifier 2 [Sciurus carolinensis]